MRSIVYAAIIVMVSIGSAVAGQTDPPSRVPEPGSVALLAAGIAALTLGTRWFRRK